MTGFAFDADLLGQWADERASQYRSAAPFPHVVMDDFLPETVLEALLEEFPSAEAGGWWRFDSDKERKLGSRDEMLMGPVTRTLFSQFNGAVFLDFLSRLTGISGLVPDPHLFGGGLHQIEPGGFLEIHADFNRHPTTGLERRLNVLLYLNRGWKEEWGGALELWSPDMHRCVQRIEPEFNRCVVFSTTDTSFHGHPTPLASPKGTTRKSLALYYYSLPPEAEGGVSHNTVFPRAVDGSADRGRSARLARELLPPIAVRALSRARRSLGQRRR